ncbi:ATP-binding protein [Natronococcus sp. A-GB1]|uniref:AlbA family DNA-binding domain-containing protein n=1 Tax=Natronococcus sp. A-GB1 TaxID=3037648 RepID=UPI00241CD0D1|nr:ATP-binding protein [Natronococcus sp. A-GB1]MDG5761909.1 ATP-binding protein [Natronococcus sp. A-GB1]
MPFDSSVDDLSLEDIHDLIDQGVDEGKTIEYKRELNLNRYPAKHKQTLVGKVISLANDDGGYCIVGVDEDCGVPQHAEGFEVDDPDTLKEQWGSILRTNTDPQLPPGVFDIGSIHVTDNNYIFVIEVDQSWRAPHRETMNNSFYARSPTGKVELTVEEVRHRILGTEKLDMLEELKQLRDDRIGLIHNRDGLASALEPGAMTVVHVLPTAMIGDIDHIPASTLPVPKPLGDTINGDDMTAEARYAWTRGGGDDWYAYGLLRNDGLYEAVGNRMFSLWNDESMIQAKVSRQNMGLDASIIVGVQRALSAFEELGFTGPIYTFISLLDAAEYKLDDSRGLPSTFLPGNRTIGTDVFTTPPAELTTSTDTIATELEPIINTIYHQMSWEDGSPNYTDGEWTGGSVKINSKQLL